MDVKKKSTFFSSVLAGALGAIAILIIVGLVGSSYWSPLFVSLEEAAKNNVCSSYTKGVYCFFADVWNDETYLATVTGFYTALITVLLALIALVGGFSFIVIRYNALGHTEDYVDKILVQPHMQHMFDTKIAAAVAKNLTDNKAYPELLSRVDAIEAAIEELGGQVSGKIER